VSIGSKLLDQALISQADEDKKKEEEKVFIKVLSEDQKKDV
jgi:hypothetical protein